MATEQEQREPAAEHGGPESPERRVFLSRLSLYLSGAIGVVVGIPIVAFLLAPLLRKPEEAWRSVGPVSNYKIGETVLVTVDDPSPLPWTGLASKNAVWLRREGDQEFQAFAVNCTHLGCPVRWLQDANLFLCPCHGGVFYKNGTVAGGPPPRPLVQYQVRARGGQVEILAGASPLA